MYNTFAHYYSKSKDLSKLFFLNLIKLLQNKSFSNAYMVQIMQKQLRKGNIRVVKKVMLSLFGNVYHSTCVPRNKTNQRNIIYKDTLSNKVQKVQSNVYVNIII